MNKSIISIVLIISMLFGMTTVSLANDPGINCGQTEDDPVIVNTIENLKLALEDKNIKFVEFSMSIGEETNIPSTVLGDGTGAYIITVGEKYLKLGGALIINGSENFSSLIRVGEGGSLVVNGNCAMVYNNPAPGGNCAAFELVYPDSFLVFEEGSRTVNCTTDDRQGRAVYANAGSLSIYDGTFFGNVNNNTVMCPSVWNAVTVEKNAFAYIYGGYFCCNNFSGDLSVCATGIGMYYSATDNGSCQLSGGEFEGIHANSSLDNFIPSYIDDNDNRSYQAIYYNEAKSAPFPYDDVTVTPSVTGVYNTITVLDLGDVLEHTFQYPEATDYGDESFTAVEGDEINFRFSAKELSDELSSKGFYIIKKYELCDFTGDILVTKYDENETVSPLSGTYTFTKEGEGKLVKSLILWHDYFTTHNEYGAMTIGPVQTISCSTDIKVISASDAGEIAPALPALTVKPPVVGDLIFGTNEDIDPEYPVTWETNWYYRNESGERTLVDLTNEAFKAGVLYECEILYTAAEGYYIPMGAVCNLNGSDISQTSYAVTTAAYSKYFRPMVDEVHLTCVKPPIVGDSYTVVPVVEGADEYGVKIATRWKKDGVFYTGTIEEGVTYTAYIQVSVKGGPGYNFTDDVEATVNGYTVPEANFNANGRQFTFEVEFAATKECTVNYVPGDADGETTVSSSFIGEEITLNDNHYTAPEGMQFKAWEIDGVEYDEGDSYIVLGDTVITAIWEEKTCNVLYDSTNGDAPMGFLYVAGVPAELPECVFIAPEGKVFAGWLIGDTVYSAGDEYVFTENLTVYAMWKDASIPGDVNGDGKVNLSDVSLLMKYIAKWDVEIDTEAADVNGDDKINLSDASLIMKFIAKWDVELK